MKCTQCGHENREGVKFCEECGKLLVVKAMRFCSNCGHENRTGIKFCEQCGTDLATGVLPSTSAGAPAALPPVVVQVAAPPHKRRFNPLLLVLLLLFMIVSCCCLLMLLGLVDTPVIAAPIVDQVRKVAPIDHIKIVGKWDPKEKPIPGCEQAAERLNPIDLNGFITCVPGLNYCTTELIGLEDWDDYPDFNLDYGWNGTVQGTASCGTSIEITGDRKVCIFPNDPQSNRVDFWLSLNGECRQQECWVEGFQPDKVPPSNPPVVNEPPVEKPDCADFQNQLASANDHGLLITSHPRVMTTCDLASDTCWMEVKGENYQHYIVNFRWYGDVETRADCRDTGSSFGCSFPYSSQSDFVDFWVSLGQCEVYLGRTEGLQQNVGAPEPPVSEPAVCCEEVETGSMEYFRNPKPNGPLHLGFDLRCDGPWQIEGDTINFDAYVRYDASEKWGDTGTCRYYGESYNTLRCEAKIPDGQQKTGKVTIELEGCPTLDITSQAPPYFDPSPSGGSGPCPSGQSMCEGSCCSIGHCCNIPDQGPGCWVSCP